MRVFVAGASGVLGRVLVPRLTGRGHTVYGMTRSRERAGEIAAGGAEPVVCDVYDRDGLDRALWDASPDVVVHQLTALPHAIDPRRIEQQLADNDRVRVEGTRNLVQGAVNAGAGKIVAQSIAFAYEPTDGPVKDEDDALWLDAPSAYRRSVEAIASLERQVMEAALDGIVLRYGYFYGPGTAYAPEGSIAAQVQARRFPVGGGGTGVFSFIHVDDAATATVAAIEDGHSGIYNIVDDTPLAVREWLPLYAQAIGAPAPRRVPGFLARAMVGRYGHDLMTRQRGASNRRARRELGWSPRYPSLQAGLT